MNSPIEMEKTDALIKKFESQNIKFVVKKYGDNKRIIFNIPAGRDLRECILIPTGKYIDLAIESSFEKFKFLNGYEGIWSPDLKVIEVEIDSIIDSNVFLIQKLKRLINGTGVEDSNELELPQIGNVKISMGFNTSEFSFLSGTKSSYLVLSHPRNKITLKISNIEITEHDLIKEFVEKISNAVFFQIDLLYNIPFILKPEKENFFDKIKKRRFNRIKPGQITEVKYDYDKEPMSLYWHAKELLNMPLFQYLAFYQVVEFYFPVYSSYEAKQKIQNLIKDPRFDVRKDSDITKIITTIKISSDGNSFGSEREQLRAVLKGCIDNSELKEFLILDQARAEFFNETKKSSKVSKQKISLDSPEADLLNEISERIYDIRCKIVHSKVSGNSSEVLLPYSDEVKNLRFDISIVEFISRKVLIANSRPLKYN